MPGSQSEGQTFSKKKQTTKTNVAQSKISLTTDECKQSHLLRVASRYHVFLCSPTSFCEKFVITPLMEQDFLNGFLGTKITVIGGG